MAELRAAELRTLRQSLPGPLVYERELSSTQSHLIALAKGGAAHLTVVLAEGQTAARGRLGRSWQAPFGKNLCFSMLFRCAFKPAVAPLLTLAASVALAETLGRGLRIKWPNDLIAPDDSKVAGVLAQGDPSGEWIVLGVGVNTDWAPPALHASCVNDWGEPVSRVALLARLAVCLKERAIALRADPAQILEAWRARNGTIGREVQIDQTQGRAVGLHASGALLVQTREGVVKRVTGDVFFCPESGGADRIG